MTWKLYILSRVRGTTRLDLRQRQSKTRSLATKVRSPCGCGSPWSCPVHLSHRVRRNHPHSVRQHALKCATISKVPSPYLLSVSPSRWSHTSLSAINRPAHISQSPGGVDRFQANLNLIEIPKYAMRRRAGTTDTTAPRTAPPPGGPPLRASNIPLQPIARRQ